MIEKRGGPNFLAELEPKFGFGEAFRIYGIERIYGITELAFQYFFLQNIGVL